jgi:hypothetical protein
MAILARFVQRAAIVAINMREWSRGRRAIVGKPRSA